MGAVEFFPFWCCSSPYYKFLPDSMRMSKRMIFALCIDCNLQSAFESDDFSSVGMRPRLSRLAAASPAARVPRLSEKENKRLRSLLIG